MVKRDTPEHKRRLAEYLHSVAADGRKTSAEMDQMAARMLRKLRPPDEPIRCCQPGSCLICGVDSPSGHVHVDLPGSRAAWAIPIGRVCSSHTFWEATKTDRLITYIEGEAPEDDV